MNSKLTRTTLLLFFCSPAVLLSAQSSNGANYFLYSLAGIVLLAFIFIIINVADNLLVIEAKQTGADRTGNNLGLFPKLREIFGDRLPDYTEGHPTTVLTKGYDIELVGEAERRIDTNAYATRFTVKPTDFIGLQPIPKVVVAVGDSVQAGDPIFYDKKMPEVQFVAPVSGEIIDIKRGDKRAIIEVTILADKEIVYRPLTPPPANASRKEMFAFLQDSGGWTLLRQRPYNTLPDPIAVPRDIFISTFDTGPLAPDLTYVIKDYQEAFQKGIDILAQLTDGYVYLGLDGRHKEEPSPVFTQVQNAQLHYFRGKHPAGNVGVQIHHIAPVSGQDHVWTLGVQEVVTIGNLWLQERFNAERVIALTGAEIAKPQYVRTHIGANIGELLRGNTVTGNVRYISGDALSGQRIAMDNFLGYYADQLTVLKEGDYYEAFGWLLPLTPRPTISGTYPNAFYGKDYKYVGDTNTHGERRAFVVTSDYEQVMPMDIYTQQLMKSILVNDFEKMEGLGIHELVEEDVALCEFVCVSKQPLQKILRRGLETMREQG